MVMYFDALAIASDVGPSRVARNREYLRGLPAGFWGRIRKEARASPKKLAGMTDDAERPVALLGIEYSG